MPSISVVVGSKGHHATIASCLESLTSQVAGNDEIIVAAAGDAKTASLVRSLFPGVLYLKGQENALVPELWKLGADRATGEVVVFTNGGLIPAADWLDVIRNLDWARISGAGGPITGPLKGGALDWAVYFSRYSGHLPPGPGGPAHDLAGDNAAYLRESLLRFSQVMEAGFWETVFHAEVLAHGGRLVKEPAMAVSFGPGNGYAQMISARFQHGKHFAAALPISHGLHLARVLLAPLVPALLLFRIAGRVCREQPGWLPRLALSSPPLLLLLIAWSIGEAAGHLKPAP